MPDWLPELAVAVAAAVLAITLHEAAHGYAALALGDDTARRRGRLSLNPIRHVDAVGTILVPGLLVLGQLLARGEVGFVFGWAKPVPVDVLRFRSPRAGMALVAAAGPGMNFALVLLAFLLGRATGLLPVGPAVPAWAPELLLAFLISFVVANLVLGLFNLIPIPPLDGSRIVAWAMPLGMAIRYLSLERAGLLLVLVVFFLLPQAVRGFDPLGWFLRNLASPLLRLVLLPSPSGPP
ncbi:site-2 protease family protein [Caldovatus sp. SYSU G05006]|uniref:Site-2 protease family protein n=1 Tax=Caldovatus aquaticus TaxID=2865671 RepID=A0ABS7F3U3_9PROT|nr:site-2 protease family protein [Caldovatus aquaticus]MBW8270272.1 site-2 protease family protein [Caldovatus aquaticus]